MFQIYFILHFARYNKVILKFVIIFDEDDYHMELVEEFISDKLGFKMKLMKY